MAEVIVFSVKSVTHGAVPLPNALSARWRSDRERIVGGGDDKTEPVLLRSGFGVTVIEIDIEDTVRIALNTKADLVFVEKTKTGTATHTFSGAVFLDETGDARSRGAGGANARTLIFACETADGTTDPHAVVVA